ncbi:MAG: SprT-like domain-containing protein [Muribaculaceae bacterium]|nr:SprT-like domain-containing protein [Muribaculaceae bacterium]
MIFNLDFIQSRFDEFNRSIFGGVLPKISIVLSDSKSTLGMYNVKYKRNSDGSRNMVSEVLRFSTNFNLEERRLEDVIIHEMIHYYISFHKLKDTTAHGKIFRSMMNEINQKFGRSITITTRVADTDNMSVSSRKWHLIAVLKLKDGKYGLKVLPRVLQTIISYRNGVMNYDNLASIAFFLHNAPYFNKFPVSGVLKFHPVEPEVLKQELIGAQYVDVQPNKVKTNGFYRGGEIF